MQVLVRVYQDVLLTLLVIMFDSSVMIVLQWRGRVDCDGVIEMERERERLDIHTHTLTNEQNKEEANNLHRH